MTQPQAPLLTPYIWLGQAAHTCRHEVSKGISGNSFDTLILGGLENLAELGAVSIPTRLDQLDNIILRKT